ncbi:MAG: HAMP domain-containing sensor histidine kinase [Pseudomonadota bacterium]
MKSFGIRERILLAALAPAILVTVLISALLVIEHTREAHIEQHRRLSAVARQIAAAAEYSLFVGDHEALGRLLETATQEPDVVAGTFLDPQDRVLVATVPERLLPDAADILLGFDPPVLSEKERHWHKLAIHATSYGEFDLFGAAGQKTPPLLGHLLLQVSNESLTRGMLNYALKALGGALSILLFGVLLALALSRGLVRSLTEIRLVIEGIRHGHHGLRAQSTGNDELGQLAQGINAMANAVAQTQETLAARVAEATATLRRERDEASQAARARSRFFAAASHDLRQPMLALGLFATRLGRDAHHSPLRPQVDQVVQSVRNLQGLLDTLLDYSRLSGQVYRIEEKPVRSLDLVARIVEEFSAAAADKRLEFRHRAADCWLLTDRALLHRILINLVGNAIRHTRRGAVLLTCRRGATHARIEVWDTGPGIPAEFHATIFDELVQLDNPERDSEKGLGLGLAIVRRTADLLRHPLALCSRVGQGSRFSVTIPLAPPRPAEEEDLLEASSDPLEDARILFISEHPGEQEEIAGMLDGWGCQLVSVADADEARSWIVVHGAPRAVLWDTADGAAGTEYAQALLDWLETATGFRLPALIVSSGPVPQLEHRPDTATRLLLTRPFRPARLRALLTRIVATEES